MGARAPAPVRARGAEDGGGAAGPSTVKGKRLLLRCLNKCNVFPCRRTLGRAMRRKARRLALAEAPIHFFSVVLCWQNVKFCECLLGMPAVCPPNFNAEIRGGSVPPPQCLAGRWAGRRAERCVAWPWRRRRIFFSLSYCVGKTLKSVNVCLQCPVFNASGVAVCRPQCLAGRWAGRRAERRVAWPWRRRRFFFSLSYCVGKTLKSVNVCLQCPVFNASGPAVCRPRCLARRWAGQRAERRVAWPWRRPECNFLSCFGRIVCGKTRCRGKTGVAMQCTASRLETLRTAPLKTP